MATRYPYNNVGTIRAACAGGDCHYRTGVQIGHHALDQRMAEHAGRTRLATQVLEHIIQNERVLERIRQYMMIDPACWTMRRENLHR